MYAGWYLVQLCIISGETGMKLNMAVIPRQSSKFCRKSNGKLELGSWVKKNSEELQEMRGYVVNGELIRGFWCSSGLRVCIVLARRGGLLCKNENQ
jgi:hypothetical protein